MIRVMAIALLVAQTALAEEITITGRVESKCVITSEIPGIYGNPTANKLSTAAADGGVQPIIRYDVSLADAYNAQITLPTTFSSSPSLSDTVDFSGEVLVKEVSNPEMASYETSKAMFGDTTQYDMKLEGSTWFEVSSLAEYGYGKAFPGGEYRAVVQAECIAK